MRKVLVVILSVLMSSALLTQVAWAQPAAEEFPQMTMSQAQHTRVVSLCQRLNEKRKIFTLMQQEAARAFLSADRQAAQVPYVLNCLARLTHSGMLLDNINTSFGFPEGQALDPASMEAVMSSQSSNMGAFFQCDPQVVYEVIIDELERQSALIERELEQANQFLSASRVAKSY